MKSEEIIRELASLYRNQASAEQDEQEARERHDAARSHRASIDARIAKTEALLIAAIRAEATGERLPFCSDQVGTQASRICPACNGQGCTHCAGHGLVASPHATRQSA